MALLLRTVVGLALGTIALIACAEPPIVTEPAPVVADEDADKDKRKDTDKNEPIEVETVPGDTETGTEVLDACTDQCSAGARRCSAASGGGTEVCEKGANGCASWRQGADCAAGTSCDKSKNDGTCVAGCTNDAGCSAANVGAETCATEGGRSRIECTKVGSCFRWAAATSCSPDEKCSAGQCKASCTNACTLGALRCAGSRSRESCIKGASGCTVWTSTTACSPDETCSAGACN